MNVQNIHITFPQSESGQVAGEYLALIEEMVQGGFQKLRDGQPIIFFSRPQESQQLFKICCIIENSPERMACSPDLLLSLLPSTVTISSSFTYRIVFTVDALLSRSFLFIYNAAALEEEGTQQIAEHSVPLPQQIELSLLLPSVSTQLAAALHFRSHYTASLLHQELVRWLSRNRSPAPIAVLKELQRFLLASDCDFLDIRHPSHLLKIVRSHLWLKEMHAHHPSTGGSEKWFYYRIFRSKLHFPFGTKNVICLVISLHCLSTYEQFDHRHIMLACKRCLPSLEAVPRSFFMYRYADEPTISFYVEVENNDGSFISSAEISHLKRELGQELSASIEQVMSRIDIPQNDEDLLHNFLLLSQQIQNTKQIPQVIIQFHGQTDTVLGFYVTVVRAIKKGRDVIPLLSHLPSEVSKCIPLRSSIIDTLRRKHLKQGLVFLVECHKEPFLRKDRSVDFLKARESVVHCIESFLGKIRDLNGGLIYQQHQLIESILPLLTKEEAKEFPIAESLFQSLSPPLMKNLLGPEHIVTVFRQLLSLKAEAKHKSSKRMLIEEYSKELFIGCICPPLFDKEAIFQIEQDIRRARHGLVSPPSNSIIQEQTSPHVDTEQERLILARCDATVDGHQFCFVICMSQNKELKEQVTAQLKELMRGRKSQKEKKSLRLSLSRPILSLDPRIGTDRMSGTIIKMLYEGLMRLDPSGTPTNAIAEEVLISEDGRSYTFSLRPTYWTNGQKVTSYDFEYAWKKILDPSFQTVFDYLLLPILNARLVKAGRLPIESLGVHCPNDRTLVVELEKPCPHFLELCCLWIYSPLCKDLDKDHPGWAYFGDRTYACNGPFTLAKWDKNNGIQLEKNQCYWDKEKVSIDHIDMKVIEDPLVGLQLFEQGALDWVGEPLAETPLCLFKQQNPHIHTNPMAAVQWYDFNVLHPPFRSAKVRRAFSYALDRGPIIKGLLYGDERPSHSIIPPDLSLLDSQDPLIYNLELARTLFREGLEEQGLSGAFLKPLKILVYDREPHKAVASAVALAWEEAFGLSFVLDIVSWHEFFERVKGTSHDIVAHVWYSWYKDSLYSLEIFKSKTNSMNSSHWSSEEYTQLIDMIEAETDTNQRNSLLKQAEEIVMHEMPVLPLYDYNSRYLKSEHLNNVYVSHLGNVDFKWATFSQPSLPSEAPEESSISSKYPAPDEIHLYLQSEPISFDPRIGGDKRNQILIRELFEGLMRIGKNGQIEEALAESVSIKDQKIYTFHLRHSLWSDGTEVTAEDFEWTIKGAVSPSFSTPFAYAFFSIKNAKKAHCGECSVNDIGVVAKDTYTLEITLERPVSYFLELTANPIYYPVCKSCASSNPRWASEVFPKFVSNGPFVLKEHAHKSQIILEKNPYYWDSDGAKSNRLTFRIIKDPQAALHMFEQGMLDWYGDPCGHMSLEGCSYLQKRGILNQRAGGGTALLICHTELPHLQSPKIRKAIAYAIDRREICNTLLHTPASSLLPPFMTFNKPDAFENTSPEKAVALFEEGLAEVGMTKERFPPLIITLWSDPTVKATVKLVQKHLKKILGIHVITSLVDWNTLLKRLSSGDFQMAVATWFSWFQDPIFTLQFLKHKHIGLNGTGWENADFIRLLDLSDSVQDDQVRKAYLKQAEALIIDEVPVIPLFYQIESYAKASGLTGEAVSPVGLMELKRLTRNR
jgi:oligopeptide transport system substrate-binding protein